MRDTAPGMNGRLVAKSAVQSSRVGLKNKAQYAVGDILPAPR